MFFGRRCCCRRRPCCCPQPQPIVEPAVNNCVEKEIFHEVEHIVPVHTHVVNKHIYNHSYRPEFTCSEEEVVINNECGIPNNLINR